MRATSKLAVVMIASAAWGVSGCETAQVDPPVVLPDVSVLEDAASEADAAADATEPADVDPPDEGAADLPPPPADVNTTPPDASLGQQPVGGVCAFDKDCEDGYCNTAYPGGYCSAKCSKDADCPEASKCFADPKGGGKMCWKACQGGWECRLDQFCPAGANICTPKCQEGDCNPGYVCDDQSGVCIFANTAPTCEPTPEVCNGVDDDCDKAVDEGCGVVIPTNETTLTEDLGLWQVGGGGLSKPISFNVSASASAFTVVVLAADAEPDIMVVWELKGPGGKVLVTGTDPLGSAIRSFPGVGVLTVQVPNTPLVQVEGGKYTMTLYREGDVSEAWVTVIQTLRQGATQSKLDVNFWFVGVPGLSAATAPTNSKFQGLVDTFEGVLAPFGLTLGKVGYYDITGQDAQKYTYLDTEQGYVIDEHGELLALSKTLPADNRGVNFFFVQGFNGWGLLGRAGGIPGPSLVHGTTGSGVAVSMQDYLWGKSELTAHAMAHELGHQLGLFHVSEQDGSMHDPIPDTPECKDMDGDGQLSPNECIGKGADNLMFWSAHGSGKLTPGQLYVIHKNACLY